MNKRLEMLRGLVETGRADSFGRYALALELRKDGQHAEALAAFEALRELDPSYLPMYFLCGQLLLDMNRESEAASWFSAGIAVAERAGDGKTLSELQAALAEI